MDKINMLAKLASCVNAVVYVADFVIRHWFIWLILAVMAIGVMMANAPSVEVVPVQHRMDLIGAKK